MVSVGGLGNRGLRVAMFCEDFVTFRVRLFGIGLQHGGCAAGIFRICVPCGGGGHLPALTLIADLHSFGGRRCLVLCPFADGRGHQFHPPPHDAVALGKEPVATDVHAVALVADRSRDAADLAARFKDDRPNVSPAQQFQRRREPCRPGSNDNGFSLLQIVSAGDDLRPGYDLSKRSGGRSSRSALYRAGALTKQRNRVHTAPLYDAFSCVSGWTT